ncbi:hypothetical protein [Actinoplanes sp. N902-109]|uniref:hypothetical protein n=1 Tax=Actinoplanes sp. (strain N902-109) TaxID=649831 RepID=UPI0003296332|nr:hypothetical protein [Actinoplanes sp. N902-109]AGL19518.1 hypothetical protein L083_6008 [Actinoplanes sp. N902-109]
MSTSNWWALAQTPILDVWASTRIQAPHADDFEARHRRGRVRLPYDLGQHSGGYAGQLVDAWVCCDPGCGGVELGPVQLERNHFCCHRNTTPQRTCMARDGHYYGPFTPYWQPDGAA